MIARYAERWAIEVSIQDAKHVTGVGEARNHAGCAVLRTVPFGFLCQTITIAWHALAGTPSGTSSAAGGGRPWYRDQRAPSNLDMLATLGRELIRAQYRPGRNGSLTRAQFKQPFTTRIPRGGSPESRGISLRGKNHP
jgi:hypothetical protein